MKDNLSLTIFTVDRQIEIPECDNIRLNIADDIKGKRNQRGKEFYV